ncbi:MAG: hypothetical protein AVDCRST_MAG08-410, partial [uncultured Acetobacteraceae bacterium]
ASACSEAHQRQHLVLGRWLCRRRSGMRGAALGHARGVSLHDHRPPHDIRGRECRSRGPHHGTRPRSGGHRNRPASRNWDGLAGDV